MFTAGYTTQNISIGVYIVFNVVGDKFNKDNGRIAILGYSRFSKVSVCAVNAEGHNIETHIIK